jgi:LysR family transcriptional regulator, nitrogen assimilation regulatory protein
MPVLYRWRRRTSLERVVNLQRLKTFLLISECGSLSKASDRMRIAQPALSRQVKLLEKEVGAALFERHRGGMRLSVAGQELLGRVSGLIRQLEQAFEDARSLACGPSGHVSFGMGPTVSHVLAGGLTLRIAKAFPGISFRVVEGYAGHLIEWIQAGRIDAAIVYGPATDFHMKVTDLLIEELLLVGPANSSIDPNVPVPVIEFTKLSVVLPSRPHGMRMVIENAVLKAKGHLTVKYEADSLRVLKDLVAKGLGYTALPLSAFSQEAKQGLLKFAPLVQPRVTRKLVLAIPESPVSHATRTVIDLAHSEIDSMVNSGEWHARLQFGTRSKHRN